MGTLSLVYAGGESGESGTLQPMSRWVPLASLVVGVLSLVLGGCTRTPSVQLEFGEDRALLSGLDACDNYGTDPVELDPARPVVVLVHGCNASSGMFLRMAEVFRQRGHQVVCFSYEDRQRIKHSARELRRSLWGLATRVTSPEITVIGHSQGGLVARAALAQNEAEPWPDSVAVRLVTISSPFNGIAVSKHCGMWPAHVLSVGIVTAICQAVAGSAWFDIHPHAAYVRSPQPLASQVAAHLVVRTDESGACLAVGGDGRCEESDDVFSLDEQTNEALLRDPRARALTLKTGHSAVVGQAGHSPTLLLRTLEREGILPRSGPGERAFLEQLYRYPLAALTEP